MRIFLLLLASLFTLKAFTQSKDSIACVCTYSYKTNYPKEAEKNKISGEVIIEIKIDSNCIWSNPVIIQKLGYGCDEEAMKHALQRIAQQNRCNDKCHRTKCTEQKIKLPVVFSYTLDD